MRIFFFLFFPISIYAQPLTINLSQIDSLYLPYTIPELTHYLNNLPKNDRDYRKIKFEIIKTYYTFITSKQELELLSIELSNLKSIWNLNIELAKKGEITDLQLLSSNNSYLGKKISLIAKEKECRNLLLEIIQLSLINIRENHEQEINQNTDR